LDTVAEIAIILPPKGQPKKKVALMPPLPAQLEQHFVSFNAGSEFLDAPQMARLKDVWHDPLKDKERNLYNAIKRGECNLHFRHLPSDQDPSDGDIGTRRMKNVREQLRRLFGPGQNIRVKAGEGSQGKHSQVSIRIDPEVVDIARSGSLIEFVR
jgi:hypothetical protein